jgi:haloalkane dehalogenase
VPISDDWPGAGEMRAVMDELSRWNKPVLVAFSDQDPVFPFPRAGEAFTSVIPSAGEQVRIEGAAHFVQEDAGERVAEEMLRFMASA